MVEFRYPGPNEGPHRVPIRDISISGISFEFPHELPEPECGLELGQVTLHFPRTEIVGDLLVMHLSHLSAGRRICGTLFYPSSEEELMKLKGVIAGFEMARSLR